MRKTRSVSLKTAVSVLCHLSFIRNRREEKEEKQRDGEERGGRRREIRNQITKEIRKDGERWRDREGKKEGWGVEKRGREKEERESPPRSHCSDRYPVKGSH